MTARWIAAGLVLLSVALYAAVAIPMQRQAAEAAEEYRVARDESRDIRARLGRLERRDAAHVRAVSALAGATPADTVRAVRRSVVGTLQEARVSGVRLGVVASHAPYSARVHLSASGPFPEVLSLVGRVARPETGVVLEHVHLAPRGNGVALDLDAVTLGSAR